MVRISGYHVIEKEEERMEGRRERDGKEEIRQKKRKEG